MRRIVTASILVLVSAITSAQGPGGAEQWKFEHYPAVVDFQGAPAKPLLITSLERSYRTRIRAQARRGPNFAGHFTLAKWGCGSPCLAFVIVDARSGTIHDPGITVGCADESCAEAGIDFKLTSRLVVLTGYSKDVGCGTDYYELDGRQLRLIHFEPWPKSNH